MKEHVQNENEMESLKGAQLRFEREAEGYDGVLVGRGDGITAAGPIRSEHPWILRLADGTTRPFLLGKWKVYKIIESYFTD
jgi:hypothetical protein